MPRVVYWLRIVAWMATLGACSSVQPQAGPVLRMCPYNSGATCSIDPSEVCGHCEAVNCCDTRLHCYTDRSCNCSDTDLDGCLGAVDGDSGSAAADKAQCWTSFAASGDVALARTACLRAYCQNECLQ